MLQSLRRGSQSYLAKAMFIVLLLSFALWGMGPVFSGARVTPAAKAGDATISMTMLDTAYRQEIQQIEQNYGIQITPEMAANLGMKLQIARRLVMESLYAQEAQKVGLVLDDVAIRQTIAAQPNLRDEEGRFSPALFKQLLGSLRMSESDYVAALKQDLSRTVLMGAIRAGAVVPDILAREVYAYVHETRAVDGLFIEAESMAVDTPTEDDLKAYYDAHQEDYRAPEYRAMDYVAVDIAALKETISPTEEALRAAYNDAPDQYDLPERRTLLQITTKDEQLAKVIAAEAKATGSLKTAAEKHSQMATELKELAEGTVIPALNSVIFALEPNVPSDAVQSPLGWHVLEVTQVTPAESREFDAVKNAVADQVKTAEANQKASELVSGLEDALAGGATIAEAAKTLGLPLYHVALVAQTGDHPDGKKAEAQPYLDEALRIGFSVGAGETSPVKEVDGRYLAVQTISIEESHIRPLVDVKENVANAWLVRKRSEVALASANKIADSVRTNTDAPALSSLGTFDRNGLKTNQSKVALDDGAVQAVFAETAGSVLTSTTKDGAWVLRVSQVIPAPLDGVDMAPVRAALREGYANDILEQYSQALRKAYGVTINEKAVQNTGTVE